MMGPTGRIHLSVVMSHYIIYQSMISICDLQKLFGGEAKNNLIIKYQDVWIGEMSCACSHPHPQ